MARKKFIPVTKCPEKNDPYYTRKEYGGYSNGINGQPQAWKGSTLNNCVGNCWGEFAKREENPNCLVGCAKGTNWPDDAKDWITNSIAQGYEVGMTAKLGAIAVWQRKGTLGHLGGCEKTYADGSWDSSESGLNTRPTWWSKHYNAQSYRNGYTFVGFVYPKDEYYIDELQVGDKVKIIAKGNARADGKGSTSYGIGYTRYIISIQEGKPYPYQVGLITPKTRTTGYYKAEALKKV